MIKSEYIKWRQEQRATGTSPDPARTSDLSLSHLLTMVEYTSKSVKVQRRKVDKLDNVTVWRI